MPIKNRSSYLYFEAKKIVFRETLVIFLALTMHYRKLYIIPFLLRSVDIFSSLMTVSF